MWERALTFALAGRVLISWMRKVSGFTMTTRGTPVVCWTQQTKPGWFITSDHWQSAGEVLLPPLELQTTEVDVVSVPLPVFQSLPLKRTVLQRVATLLRTESLFTKSHVCATIIPACAARVLLKLRYLE